MRKRSKILTLAATLVGLLLIPTTALAYAPTGDDFITCVAGGDNNIECVAGIFDANTACTYEASTGATGTATTNGDGEVSFDFDVPTDNEAEVELTIQCGPKVLADGIANVNAEGEVIANAGSDTGLLAIGALGAIALGGAALFISRRTGASNVA